jgi:hypothetical protein
MKRLTNVFKAAGISALMTLCVTFPAFAEEASSDTTDALTLFGFAIPWIAVWIALGIIVIVVIGLVLKGFFSEIKK